jgi:hypothetical protein
VASWNQLLNDDEDIHWNVEFLLVEAANNRRKLVTGRAAETKETHLASSDRYGGGRVHRCSINREQRRIG